MIAIALGRRGPRGRDPATEVRSLLAAAAALDPGAGPFRLQGKTSARFDPTRERALHAALALAVPSHLNAQAGIPCRITARSERGRVFELSWPALPAGDDAAWNLEAFWPIPAESDASRETEGVLRLVRAFAEAFSPRFIEVGPVGPFESVLGGAWLVAQPGEGSPTLLEACPAARPAPPIGGLPAFTAHLASPFSAAPDEGEARRVLLRVARRLRDQKPVAQRAAPPEPEPPPPPPEPAVSQVQAPLRAATVALDPSAAALARGALALPFQPASRAPTTDLDALKQSAPALPFHGDKAPPAKALENALAHAQAVQRPATPNRAASGATVALDDLPREPLPRSAPVEPPPVSVPNFTLEQYASLCVEIALGPDRVAHTLVRYHLTPEVRAALDVQWRARFAADPGLRTAFAQAYAAYKAMITDPGRKAP
jgi:hypothetical protein